MFVGGSPKVPVRGRPRPQSPQKCSHSCAQGLGWETQTTRSPMSWLHWASTSLSVCRPHTVSPHGRSGWQTSLSVVKCSQHRCPGNRQRPRELLDPSLTRLVASVPLHRQRSRFKGRGFCLRISMGRGRKNWWVFDNHHGDRGQHRRRVKIGKCGKRLPRVLQGFLTLGLPDFSLIRFSSSPHSGKAGPFPTSRPLSLPFLLPGVPTPRLANSSLEFQFHGAICQDAALPSCPDREDCECLLGSFSCSEQDPTQDGTPRAAQSPMPPFLGGDGKVQCASTGLVSAQRLAPAFIPEDAWGLGLTLGHTRMKCTNS